VGVNKDRLTKERRSWNMSRIRGKDTTPEKAVRSLLHRMGYRFRLHVRIPLQRSAAVSKTSRSNAGSVERSRIGKASRSDVPAAADARAHSRAPRAVSVDILLPKHKTAIFIHGRPLLKNFLPLKCVAPTCARH
jgi:hypothetical protein